MENEIKQNELEKVEEAAPIEEVTSEPEETAYSSEYLQTIEDARQKFLKVYKTQNTLKWIISALSIVMIIFGFIFFPNMVKGTGGMAGMIAIGVGAIALTLTYSIITKRNMNKRMKDYFALYYDCVNKFAFEGDDFANMKSQFPGKIQDEAFTDNCMFKDVTTVGSRGLTELEYKGTPIAVCDCAAQTVVDRRAKPVFVGKYLYAAANYDFDEPVYIYLKGDERSLPPTNLDEVNVVSEDDKMIIRSSNKDWKKVISPEVKKLLGKVKMNKYLVDLSISLQRGRVFVCMGYDDPLMILPLQNKFDAKPNEQFKKDVYNILDLIKEFDK